MIVQISEIIGNSTLEVTAGIGHDSMILLAILALGSAVTGGFPMLSAPSFEFSLNRVFILSLFFLCPHNPTVYFALASVVAGAALRRTVSSRQFWRYVTSGILMVLLLEFGPVVYQKLNPGVPVQMITISVLPVLILIEVIITIIFSVKGSDISKLSGWILISYIAAIPLSLMTVIMVIKADVLGAALASVGLTGFSFIGRSINRKNQWNAQRIKEISLQDRLAARLMKSSSYIEYIYILQNNIFKYSGSRIRALTRSTGTYDWILWSSDEQSCCMKNDVTGTIPSKSQFTNNFSVKSIKGTALGLTDNKDVIIVFSGPEKDILQKIPFNLLENLVLLLVHSWETVGHALRSERSFLAAAVMLARLADSKDNYTHGHSLRVANLSYSLGKYLHLSPENIQTLRVAAILHDIGKLAIPASILTKRGLLTKKEREIMEAHPEEGARIVSGLSGYEEVVEIIRSHHERLDGNGYPDGLRNGDIPFMARIVAVADTYDAITSNRSYHSISGGENALESIRAEEGSKFDSRIVSALESILKNEKVSMA
ncbi:MAG: HD-GYP domain-containing protein [Candidatus Aegiribacteria sp.]|nr:HD-GYP domain-containing protein [Candidatus Aegiribacteria sp.]